MCQMTPVYLSSDTYTTALEFTQGRHGPVYPSTDTYTTALKLP